MKVELIQGTKNTVKLLADIASICYGHESARNPQKLIEDLAKLGHHSVFEHAYYTFKIEGISRACLAQLTRHRHASYTVRSQRYCDESETKLIIPKEIKKEEKLMKMWNKLNEHINEIYKMFTDNSIKREDARSILPQSTSTDLYMSLNLRELMHIHKLRSTSDAQEEIRELVDKMVKEITFFNRGLTLLFKEEY